MIISSEHALKSVLRDDLDGGAPQHYIVDRAAEYVPEKHTRHDHDAGL